MNTPKHVAIIMDGNGRWAQRKMLPRYLGHREGVKALKRIIKCCGQFGIEMLTVYAFSTENWQRPAEEVDYLLKLMEQTFVTELDELVTAGVRIKVLGDMQSIPPTYQRIWQEAEERTKGNDKLYLNVAFNYGGRNEIVRAIQAIAVKVIQGEITVEQITENLVAQHLYTSGLPDPDLVIRTGGEIRMSNFLLWQCAYAEWYFTQTLWPDSGVAEFEKALESFAKRERRYGRIKEN